MPAEDNRCDACAIEPGASYELRVRGAPRPALATQLCPTCLDVVTRHAPELAFVAASEAHGPREKVSWVDRAGRNERPVN